MIFRRRPKRFDKRPSSPCVKVCKFSAGGDFCIGCRRTREEIARWWQLDEAARHKLEQELRERRG